jgi:hypothetical protein
MKFTYLVFVSLFALLFECSAFPSQNVEATGTAAASLAVCPTPSQLVSDLSSATQASVVSLSGVDPTTCPEVSMTQTWSGGELVFSDSPESPTTREKLYEDTTLQATGAAGPNRIFVYHVNGQSSGYLRFTVLVTNNGTSAATLTVQQSGLAGPTTSYLYAGKMAFDRWLTSTAGTGVSVNPGATVRLDSTFDTTNVAPGYLMNGIWDYTMTQPHTVTICAIGKNDNPLTVCPTLPLAQRDTHVRGTFPNNSKIYDTSAGVTVDTANGIQAFPLASGTVNDPWAVGTDATDGSQQTLGGNYGILYRMHLNTSSSDGQNFGMLLNPRGGTWGGAVWAEPGIFTGGKFLIPPSTGSVNSNTQGAVEGEYTPGTGFTVWLQFMPTGGSSFPLQFVMTPF